MTQESYLYQKDDTLYICGSWTLAHYQRLRDSVQGPASFTHIDLSHIEVIDTSGAQLLIQYAGAEKIRDYLTHHPQDEKGHFALIQAVLQAVETSKVSPVKPSRRFNILEELGMFIERLWHGQLRLLGMFGEVLSYLFLHLFKPKTWRLTSTLYHLQTAGFEAVPIIALMTFMVGAVVAFLGATVLSTFGVEIYTVRLVGFSFLREFAVILVAILVAGRTASAYTAQIGSMKVNEELDALKASGSSLLELLVIPRVLALFIALPLLTVIGMICGLLGGMLVCMVSLNISPTIFLVELESSISVSHFFVGLSKAPVMAIVIAMIGCTEGFKVESSAQSVGEHTTSSVVQSIFMVILLDAIFAIFCMEMGW
ncbi:ABC transporter permease [Basilea psittacipulmonis]|nr:ABC transporter permease [Basilea psittacipulmonis]